MIGGDAMNNFRRTFVAGAGQIFLAFAAVAGAQAAPGPDLDHTITMARRMAWKVINSGQGSGISVAILERGKFVYSESMGVADRAQNLAVDRDTRFNVGSVGKMFAAPAVPPFNASKDHTNVGWLFKLLSGSSPAFDAALSERLRTPPPVPTTAIYSKSDGVVAWQRVGQWQPYARQP